MHEPNMSMNEYFKFSLTASMMFQVGLRLLEG